MLPLASTTLCSQTHSTSCCRSKKGLKVQLQQINVKKEIQMEKTCVGIEWMSELLGMKYKQSSELRN